MGKDNYFFPPIEKNPVYDFTDKKVLVQDLMDYTYIRTQKMFKYDGLPDTIPQIMLERLLQTSGFACIAEHNGNIYAFYGGLGSIPNEYYQPTQCIVNNPYLKFNKTLTIGTDCVIIKNDFMRKGLYPLISRYATLQAENAISLRIASINKRITSLLSAADERTRASAEQYLKNMEEGKIGIVGENPFFEGIRSQPYQASSGSTQITELIEFYQFMESKLYNELGLQANYNMKRESLSAQELGLNNDTMLPMVDQMLLMRQNGVDEVNKMFGTSISVDFDSSWLYNQQETKAEIENLQNEVQTSGQEEPDGKSDDGESVSDSE